MIRFVDIRNQGTCNRFAFWDTIYDQFLKFGGRQGWENWDEFLDDYSCESPSEADGAELRRLRGLCPAWVFDKGEDDIEGWYDGKYG